MTDTKYQFDFSRLDDDDLTVMGACGTLIHQNDPQAKLLSAIVRTLLTRKTFVGDFCEISKEDIPVVAKEFSAALQTWFDDKLLAEAEAIKEKRANQ